METDDEVSLKFDVKRRKGKIVESSATEADRGDDPMLQSTLTTLKIKISFEGQVEDDSDFSEREKETLKEQGITVPEEGSCIELSHSQFQFFEGRKKLTSNDVRRQIETLDSIRGI